jgi:two-component system, cell cycle response regulator
VIRGEISAATLTMVGLGAGLAILLVVVAVLAVKRRSQPRTEGRIASVVADLNTRMSSMMRELDQALEQAEGESRRLRLLSNLVGSIELQEVLERTLEAASGIPGADASLVAIRRAAEGKPLVATLGLAPVETDLEGFSAGPPDGSKPRAITLSYRYDASELEGSEMIQAGLAVPLSGEGQFVGHIAVFTRSPDQSFSEASLQELEELAQRAGHAIENARRFQEIQRLADVDLLTGLRNRQYFHAALAREVGRAHRYGRTLALVVLELDGLDELNERGGSGTGDAVLRQVADRIEDTARSADIACRLSGDQFAIILPESTLADAERLAHRIHTAVTERPIGPIGSVKIATGAAELRLDDDSVALFERADDNLYRGKRSVRPQIEAPGDPDDSPPEAA